MKRLLPRSLLFLLLIASFCSAQTTGWWSLSDADFVAQYGKLATGTQAQQSQFAWMLFARANQPVTFNQQTFSQWELWPSDPDTFAPNAPAFTPANKIRTRPHLQPSRLATFARAAHRLSLVNPFPPGGGGEEVTRNPLSYDYIIGKGLNTQAGIVKYLASSAAKIDFPMGAVETKAFWVRGTVPGAYQVAGFSLTGIHLMVKIAARPNDPFTDNTPSWFWTTFEFKNNKGLSAAQKFITYGDVLPPGGAAKLLTEAGLANTPFANYVSNGQQIQYYDAKNKTIVLGNTQIEWFLANPANQNPVTWKSWSSSCHSCHGQASGQPSGGGMTFFEFTGPVGPLTGANLPPAGYQSLDFVWALANAQ